MSMYPDDMPAHGICIAEGCVGYGPCPRCGQTNYALMGWHGAVASAAKRWGVSKEEAAERITAVATPQGEKE